MPGNEFSGRKPKLKPHVTAESLGLQLGDPEIPELVSSDALALAHWEAICDDLRNRKALSPSFGPLITRASKLLAHLDRIERAIADTDYEYVESSVTKHGALQQRRAALMTTMLDLSAKLVAYLDRLGTTPIYAAKVPRQSADPHNPDLYPIDM